MKYTLLIILMGVLSFHLSAAQGSLQALDEKCGFRDVKLGADISSFPDMVEIKTSVQNDPDFKMYSRPSEVLKLGEVLLSHIYYHFYKGKLRVISIDADPKYSSDMLGALEQAYGYGERLTNTVYSWSSQKVLMSLITKDEIMGRMDLIFKSKEVEKQYEVDRLNKRKKLANEL